jgi:hypothetical protein
MRACAHLLFLACLLFPPFHAVSGKGVLAPEVVPFDRYGRIDWDDEKPRLDKFASELKNKPESIAYIYVQVAQISCWGEGLSHAIGRTRYLIQTHNLPWNRVAWRNLGYGDSFEVSLWLFPAGQPPLYVPEYKPETSSTFIEDCEMMTRSRPLKPRTSRGAANKGLQRTRR